MILWHVDRPRRQRRAADPRQIQIELEMPHRAQCVRYGFRGFELADVPLAVIDAERRNGKAITSRDGSGGIGVQAAAQKNDGIPVPGSRFPAAGFKRHEWWDSRCT